MTATVDGAVAEPASLPSTLVVPPAVPSAGPPSLAGVTPGAAPRWLAWPALLLPTAAVAAVARPDPHWCFVPIWACGVVTVWAASREIAAARSLLRTPAAVWLFLVHFVFLAPLLHLHLDFWLRFVERPADMRPWLGRLAALTLPGLLFMLAAQRLVARRAALRLVPRELRTARFRALGLAFVAVSLAALARILVRFGGVGGVIAAFERGFEEFVGMGPWFVLAQASPTLAAALTFGLVRDRSRFVRLGPLLLLGFAVLQALLGGLQGSRANTLFGVLWAVVVWDACVRPLRMRTVLALGGAVLTFLFVFGLYKAAGRKGLHSVRSPTALLEEVASTGRSVEALILLDLGRFDVQALLLERFAQPSHPRLARGRTYVAGVVSPIPTRLWPGKPEGKVREGTDALWGPGALAGTARATNQYGLAGEAVLNFGPWAIPVVYALFGALVGVVARLEATLDRRDPRWLLLAFAPTIAVRILMTDTDNVVFVLLQSYLLLGPLVWLATHRVPGAVPAAAAGTPPRSVA